MHNFFSFPKLLFFIVMSLTSQSMDKLWLKCPKEKNGFRGNAFVFGRIYLVEYISFSQKRYAKWRRIIISFCVCLITCRLCYSVLLIRMMIEKKIYIYHEWCFEHTTTQLQFCLITEEIVLLSLTYLWTNLERFCR